MADITVSGTTDPSNYQSYTIESNDKNTLTMTDYFKLLAAQLQNQDVTNPMDNSEMMAQMVQMGMMQAMNAMTESMEVNTATTTQTYAGSLLGQEVTVMVTEKVEGSDREIPVGVKYGKVEYVSFVNGTPKFKLEGDTKEYTMSYMVGVGKIPDPYADREDGSGEDLKDPDKVEGSEDSKEPEGTTEGTKDPVNGAEGSEGTKEPTDAGTEAAGSNQGAQEPTTPPENEVTGGAEEGAAAAAGITA